MAQLTKLFGKIANTLPIPHLLELQVDSYLKFLQRDVPPASRADLGLEAVFRSVFPIEDFNKTASLEYVSYIIQEPKYDEDECIAKGLTFEAPIRLIVRLVVFDVDEESGARTIRDIKEQDIYFGTIPLMTDKGTFIINGTERVIVNQLQRSPGIIFEHDSGKTHSSRKVLYSCRIIPMRGSWLDFDFDHKDILYVRIDRRRKMPATILFKAMGMTKTDILDYFYDHEEYIFNGERVLRKMREDQYRKEDAYVDVVLSDGKVLVKKSRPITKGSWRKMIKDGQSAIEVAPESLIGQYLAHDIVDLNTGEVVAEAAQEISADLIERIRSQDVQEISVLFTRGMDVSSSMRDTLAADKTTDIASAQIEIYRRLRPSSPPTAEIASSFFENLFRSADYYDLSTVGRYKLNTRMDINESLELRTLTNEDILKAVKVLVKLKDSHGPADDIDHLG
ncbi:MAG: DNA-directed RNA polymerase subunit beta, partial [Humidesulfovibrio sp.]|nr:DNA-directed RNA polymerase subunit beta [Humidesulfovibrio sp.]